MVGQAAHETSNGVKRNGCNINPLGLAKSRTPGFLGPYQNWAASTKRHPSIPHQDPASRTSTSRPSLSLHFRVYTTLRCNSAVDALTEGGCTLSARPSRACGGAWRQHDVTGAVTCIKRSPYAHSRLALVDGETLVEAGKLHACHRSLPGNCG